MLIALAEGEVVEVTFRITLVEFVREPLVPVMVRVGLPTGVLPFVVTVSVELTPGVIEVGLNEAIAPIGSPLVTLRFTAPVKPFTAVVLTIYVALPPGFKENEPGEAKSVKTGGSVTFSVIVALWVSGPLVPVTVRVELPTGVLSVVVIVRVELPELLIETGENVAVAPVGRPLALRLTEPVYAFVAPRFTVYVVLPPAFTVWVDGVADTEKSELGTI
jgi:hypothetical protein